MAGEVYAEKLERLRSARFPEPVCFKGLTLHRRTEPGVFPNTGEPRVFYRFEKTTTTPIESIHNFDSINTPTNISDNTDVTNDSWGGSAYESDSIPST